MTVIWVHEDAMCLDDQLRAAAGPSARPIFIWDTKEHDRRQYSLKRRVFIYECAIDLNIPIYSGDTYGVLKTLAGTNKIFTTETPDRFIQDIVKKLRDDLDVVSLQTPGIANIPLDTDTNRFFRFWNIVKTSALTSSMETQNL